MYQTLLQSDRFRFPLFTNVAPWVYFWLLAFAGSLIYAASAQLVIPLFPVPVTAQTMVIMGFGLAVGWRLAGASVLIYLAEGMMGFPVYSKFGSGIAHLMGPTTGYLIGFVFAATWCGWCAEKGLDRKLPWLFIALVGAELLIFIPGTLWLTFFLGGDFYKAFGVGVAPFLLPEAIKIAILSAIFPVIWLSLGSAKK